MSRELIRRIFCLVFRTSWSSDANSFSSSTLNIIYHFDKFFLGKTTSYWEIYDVIL